MRLLNVKSRLFEEFVGKYPLYAILSHTWEEEEVTFQDYQSGSYENLAGFSKIDNCCRIASDMGLEYAWIDTCCIDKSSSTELQESINSMFQWYRNSSYCVTYLSDVSASQTPFWIPYFDRSRWFTRGWTLQELLASDKLGFFDQEWNLIGAMWDLRTQEQVERITGIDRRFLQDTDSIFQASVAIRMSWASCRSTTRQEDMAYCLLGLFDVNMPLLYGEGTKAFARLQEEIIKKSDDETIFAWHYGYSLGQCHHGGLFAKSPKCFKNCIALDSKRDQEVEKKHYSLTNRGLYIKPRLIEHGLGEVLLLLNCSPMYYDEDKDNQTTFLAVPISSCYKNRQACTKGASYWRSRGSLPFFIKSKDNIDAMQSPTVPIYLQYKDRDSQLRIECKATIVISDAPQLHLTHVHPSHSLSLLSDSLSEVSKKVDLKKLPISIVENFHFVVGSYHTSQLILVYLSYTHFLGSRKETSFTANITWFELQNGWELERLKVIPDEFLSSIPEERKQKNWDVVIGDQIFKIWLTKPKWLNSITPPSPSAWFVIPNVNIKAMETL